MELHVVIEGGKDLSGQIYRQLRAAIESGRLAAGTQLPPSRLLAQSLGVSRKTVADAYARLSYDNLLVGKVGVGTFVNAHATRTQHKRQPAELASARVLEQWRGISTGLQHPEQGTRLRYSFIGGATSRNHFPQEQWRRCVQYALRQSVQARGMYSQAAGLPVLREAIARHIAFSRGLRCTAEDLVVCNGAQQALDLIARVLIEPGCRVAVEEPGYPPARQLFAAQGAQVVGVPVDAEGLCVAAIPDDVRLIYVTPSHQFPLGMPMSAARRRALLERALALGAIVIEDDYDCEFRYEGRPDDTLHSRDRHGLVAYVGTFSKTLLPELRLGYAVLPPALLEAVVAAKQLSDWHTPTLIQWALAHFLRDGLLLKHIRRCHGIYASRRERLLQRFAGDLAPWFELVPAVAGFHLAALARRPLDIAQLLEVARQAELELLGLAPFFQQSPRRDGLLLGYGAIDTLDIDPALDRLRELLQGLAPLP